MIFQAIGLRDVQAFENNTEFNHILIQFRTPHMNYPTITYSEKCLDEIKIHCHDIENPPTEFNNKVIRDFPHFYKEPMIYFSREHALQVLKLAFHYYNAAELCMCQCDAGVSRSTAVAAALSKIFNNDDFYFFQNYVPNQFIYRTILEVYHNEVKDDERSNH